VLHAVWLCKVAERQMLRPSFVPPRPIRELRDFTRFRIDLVAARGAEKNRVEKLLEDACIKLSVVASDIFGVSGQQMMAAMIARERDPKVLAGMARTRMRAKIPQLQEAFTGHFDDHHRFLLAQMLARIDGIDADIAVLDAQIETIMTPFAQAAQRLDEMSRHRTGRGSDHHRGGRSGHVPVPHRWALVLVGRVLRRSCSLVPVPPDAPVVLGSAELGQPAADHE
jgi:transposase